MSAALLTACAFAAALVATLALASVLTPAHWWRRPNARALALVVAGTWGIGSVLAGLLPPPAIASVPLAAAQAQYVVGAGGRNYQVFDALNLRDGTGIGARRIAVLPPGSIVFVTGKRDGDWWQVRARVGGRPVAGWASSLWLRRADEQRR